MGREDRRRHPKHLRLGHPNVLLRGIRSGEWLPAIGLGSCWRPRYEFIAWYEKGNRPGNHNNRPNVLTARRVARGYPTEKPVPLLSELIAQASDESELVLDPFCGSGNIGQAARALRRTAILCDTDTAFAARRLHLAIESFDPLAK